MLSGGAWALIGVSIAYIVILYLWSIESKLSLAQWVSALLFLGLLFGPVIIGALVLALFYGAPLD
jgi:hypothetical protein